MQKTEYKLTFLIATMNRPYAIKELVNNYADFLNGYNISLQIVDGSEGSDTEDILKACKKENVFYRRMPGASVMERTMAGIECLSSEYVCIGGDTKLPDKAILESVLNDLENGYSMLLYYPLDIYKSGTKEYASIVDFYKEHGWQTILYSSCIIKLDDFEFPDYNLMCRQISDSNFFHTFMYFGCYTGAHFRALYRPMQFCRESFKGKKDSWWLNHDDYYKLWFNELPETLEKLPDIFSDYHKAFLLGEGTYGHKIDKLEGLIKLKSKGCLTASDVDLWYQRYKDYGCKLLPAALKRIAEMDAHAAGSCHKVLSFVSRINDRIAYEMRRRLHS